MAKQPVKFSGPNKSKAKQVVAEPGKKLTNSDTPVKMGRPTIYTEELADEICEKLALGKSLVSICEKDEMPGYRTVMTWRRDNEDFRQRYERACEDRGINSGDRVADMIEQVLTGEIPADVARVALDNLKWMACKYYPKMFGDKQQVDVRVDLGKTAATVLMELSNKANENNLIDVTPTKATP